jgi:hypothetical protein
MKGQISLDLIFTLIIVLIFIGTISVFADNARQHTQEVLLKNQLRIIGSNYATYITKAQTLTDTTFVAKLKIDEINYNGKRYFPIFAFEDNLLTIKIFDSNQNEKIYYSNQDITIMQDIDYLVIKSA